MPSFLIEFKVLVDCNKDHYGSSIGPFTHRYSINSNIAIFPKFYKLILVRFPFIIICMLLVVGYNIICYSAIRQGI